jgi:RNA polymerase sigma-70 factor, ECF subfamily
VEHPDPLEPILRRLASHSYADPDTWEELYRILWPWLLAKAHTRLTGDLALAEDISQEVMLRLLRGPQFGVFENAARLRGYVKQVCEHLVIDEIRKQKARGVHVSDQDVPARSADLLLGLTLGEARARLEDDDSILLNLLLAGLTPTEIARQLSLSTRTVYNKTSELRQKLRRLVKPPSQNSQ